MDLIKTISASNENAILFCFLGVPHQAVEKTSVMNHRRLLEDKLVGQMDMNEVHLFFQDSGHGGDKRRNGQTCSSVEFSMRQHVNTCELALMLLSTGILFDNII